MKNNQNNANELPLSDLTIAELFTDDKSQVTYQIPMYQRNYAWSDDEIKALIQDVSDACDVNKPAYYIGTLVTYQHDNTLEVIDGQQRLTTIFLILACLGEGEMVRNRLTYRAREISNRTLTDIIDGKVDKSTPTKDDTVGIINGYKVIKGEFGDSKAKKQQFRDYFLNHVHIIRYKVPKDIDLNHYFEVMNSRGEQLESHEIVKSNLMQKLNDDNERAKFAQIWDACSVMNTYIQQQLPCNKSQREAIFGSSLHDFSAEKFEDIELKQATEESRKLSIKDLIKPENAGSYQQAEGEEQTYTFLPIIDFPNFLLIVLKLTIKPSKKDSFTLDDKQLLKQFELARLNEENVKKFAFNLLKAKYFLDNYIVHHKLTGNDKNADETQWDLEHFSVSGEKTEKYVPLNLVSGNKAEDKALQQRLVHLLSMFEITYTARQRKNYLFYCMMYLFSKAEDGPAGYCDFLQKLARKYLINIYFNRDALTDNYQPKPDSFDGQILTDKGEINLGYNKEFNSFDAVYGHAGTKIPQFLFNYLDYKIWDKYEKTLRGENQKVGSPIRKRFFDELGCPDFGLDYFKDFYFSRTRRSLEHFFPQANVKNKNIDVNCFGNFALIGLSTNINGSNWDPQIKVDHYLKDTSGKVSRVSVASLKFLIMMKRAEKDEKWENEQIKDHQEKMVKILTDWKL